MTKSRFFGTALSITFVVLAASSFAAAQATRTWVSGVGDDANPCSRTAPCKTFAGAISKTADGGEIDAIDPGGFGAVTITKGITIDGGGTFASILAAGTNGVIVNAANTKVITLRNLSINGAGTGVNGIRLLAGGTFLIENVQISGFTGNGIDAPTLPVGSRVFINDVDIRNISGASSIGVKLGGVGVITGSMDHLRVERVFTGVQIGTFTFPTIRNSVLGFGGTKGLEILASTSRVTVENTILSENVTGLTVGSGATVLLSQTSITECSTGIVSSGTVQSSGNNRILGNGSDGVTPTIVNPK